MIESAANRSEKMPCAARPMAMPPMPRPATRPVTLTPRLSRMRMIAIANSATVTSSRMMPSAEPRPAASSSLADPVLDQPEDQLARPDRRLEEAAITNRMLIDAKDGRRRRGMFGDQLGRAHDDEEDVGLRQHPAEDDAPVRVFAARRRSAGRRARAARAGRGRWRSRSRRRSAMSTLLSLNQSAISLASGTLFRRRSSGFGRRLLFIGSY